MIRKLSAPFNVTLSITNKCNFYCKHCFLGDSLGTNGELTTQELYALIDNLAQAKVFTIGIGGGEPFCRKDILQIIDHIHSKPLSLSLNTNATLVTKKIAKKLAGYNKLKFIVVSFDGDSEKVMDGMRGKGAFRQALKGIENILATKRLGVLLSVTVTRINFKRIKEIAVFAKKIGASGVRYNSVVFCGNACTNIEEIKLSPQEHRETLDLVKEARMEWKDFISGSYLTEIKMIENFNQQELKKLDHLIIYPCKASTERCGISADGWVLPCEMLCNVKAGNIRQRDFLDIWQNSQVMQSFREAMVYSLKGHPRCIGCRYKQLCYQGQRCKPYYYSSNLNPEDVGCILA
jgi:radical SAM protein with 4Fe4S-binding SPASM domain